MEKRAKDQDVDIQYLDKRKGGINGKGGVGIQRSTAFGA